MSGSRHDVRRGILRIWPCAEQRVRSFAMSYLWAVRGTPHRKRIMRSHSRSRSRYAANRVSDALIDALATFPPEVLLMVAR